MAKIERAGARRVEQPGLGHHQQHIAGDLLPPCGHAPGMSRGRRAVTAGRDVRVPRAKLARRASHVAGPRRAAATGARRRPGARARRRCAARRRPARRRRHALGEVIGCRRAQGRAECVSVHPNAPDVGGTAVAAAAAPRPCRQPSDRAQAGVHRDDRRAAYLGADPKARPLTRSRAQPRFAGVAAKLLPRGAADSPAHDERAEIGVRRVNGALGRDPTEAVDVRALRPPIRHLGVAP